MIYIIINHINHTFSPSNSIFNLFINKSLSSSVFDISLAVTFEINLFSPCKILIYLIPHSLYLLLYSLNYNEKVHLLVTLIFLIVFSFKIIINLSKSSILPLKQFDLQNYHLQFEL